jgi:hypothetical protein
MTAGGRQCADELPARPFVTLPGLQLTAAIFFFTAFSFAPLSFDTLQLGGHAYGRFSVAGAPCRGDLGPLLPLDHPARGV